MRLIISVLLLALSLPTWGYSVASQQDSLFDSHTQRTLNIRIFYPTNSRQPGEIQAANAVFTGFNAIKDAPLAAGRFPLIVLSHGSGGNNASLAWLAVPLAARGAIVIAANHPGSTTGDSRPSTDLTLQTVDLSFMLSHYLNDKRWQQAIDKQKVGAIGHSKGGYSVLALVGGRVNRARFSHYCQTRPEMPDCEFYHRNGKWVEQTDDSRLAASYLDARVKFAIALDPAMSYVLLPESLKQIAVPVLAVAAGYYTHASGALNLGVDKLKLPHLTLRDAGHYDFLPLCQPAAAAILAQEGEAFICETAEAQREAIHQATINVVSQFMQRHGFLPARL